MHGAQPLPASAGVSPIGHEAADLVHIRDDQPGIRRRGAGHGFYYLDPDGNRVEDDETRARIRSLAIPPAWTDVWISPDPAGHIQATGRDQRGRKQYRYHPTWTACRDEAKFSTLISFAEALPDLRRQVDSDLRRHGLPRERVVASVVYLLDRTLIRIGNDDYARTNKSFGLTTLRSRHVAVEGSKIRFAFMGKSGQEWRLKLADRRIAKIVETVHDLPGQHLFQYLDEDDNRHPIHSHDVNRYIHEAAGPEFTSKHFRTWGATMLAANLFAETDLPETKRARARAANAVVDRVANQLRNTRSVCRQCYIHPAVPRSWQEGRLSEEIGDIRRRNRRPLKGLDQEESTVLRWLREQQQG